MVIYRRKVQAKLILLRLFFIVVFPINIMLFKLGFSNLGYLLAVITICMAFIVVQGLVIRDASIEIKKYYFFGLLPVTWAFDNKVLSNAQLVKAYEEYHAHTDTWLDLLAIFFPIEGKFLRLEVSYIRSRDRTGFVNLYITNEEHRLLSSRIEQAEVYV